MVIVLLYYFSICLEGLRVSIESPVRIANLQAEYEELLTFQLQCLVACGQVVHK